MTKTLRYFPLRWKPKQGETVKQWHKRINGLTPVTLRPICSSCGLPISLTNDKHSFFIPQFHPHCIHTKRTVHTFSYELLKSFPQYRAWILEHQDELDAPGVISDQALADRERKSVELRDS